LAFSSARLIAVPEPADWRTWPLADDPTVTYGWDPHEAPTPPELWLRHDPKSDLFVIGGTPRAEEAPLERFHSAFRREAGWHAEVKSSRAAACSVMLGLALAVLVAGLATARRRLRAAGALAESSREAFLSLSSDPPSYRSAPTAMAQKTEDAAHDARSRAGARREVGALRAALVGVAGLVTLFFVCAGGVMLREWVRLMF